jgi:hypothetical protein
MVLSQSLSMLVVEIVLVLFAHNHQSVVYGLLLLHALLLGLLKDAWNFLVVIVIISARIEEGFSGGDSHPPSLRSISFAPTHTRT